MRALLLVVGTCFSLVLCPLSTEAQERDVLSPAEMEAALGEHRTTEDADRAVLGRVLSNPSVEAQARRAGLHAALDRARTRAAALEGEPLASAAAQARSLEEQLAGGQTVVMTATTIIIVLLIIIIIVLIA